MRGRGQSHAQPWQFWCGGLGGVLALAYALTAASHSPTLGGERRTSEEVSSASTLAAWRPGVPVSIRVDEGRATFRCPGDTSGASALVIVSSLARGPGPFPMTIRVRGTDRPEAPALADDRLTTPSAELSIASLPPVPEPPTAAPASERTFSQLIHDGDVASGRNYAPFRGILRGFGKRVQVYVASEDLDRVGADVLRDLVESFDDRIFPTSARTIGQAMDVDRDGRFTIFLSSRLARLGGGKHAVDGFVRAADLDVAYSAPFGNRCDMMYLNTDLEAGPHLRTIVAHEYAHAVLFSRKSLAPGRTSESPRVEEEGWLDEALAHLAEDLHGFSRSNLDYRVSAFLAKPERYRLVVEDYYAANLFRSHGNRGSTYLFLRWCADRYGPDLLPSLIGSDRAGTANLEAATGSSFANLYRRWSVALAGGSLGATMLAPETLRDGYKSVDLRGPADGRPLSGPRVDRVRPSDGNVEWLSTGTSSRFLLVDAGHSGAVEVEVAGPREAEIQVTAISLTAGLTSMAMKVRPSYDRDGMLRLTLAIEGQGTLPVRFQDLAWEPLIPPPDPKSGNMRGQLGPSELAPLLGRPTLDPGGTLRSRPIRLPGVHRASGPYVLKLNGTDARGLPVTAWAEINPESPPSMSSPGWPEAEEVSLDDPG